ncbi:MAG: monovalent cation/H(+) antiporter subunit G [Alphaproteobacteria bacterium]|nr:monovalent cation/H(+) antiporter subunit G [Alphaproteobacteria bacterium]
MSLILDIASIICFIIGAIAMFTGSLGLLRLPDVYSRIHAAGIIDTAAVGFIILGMMLQAGLTLTSAKLALIVLFLFFTSPISGHAIAMMAHKFGVEPNARQVKASKMGGKNG